MNIMKKTVNQLEDDSKCVYLATTAAFTGSLHISCKFHHNCEKTTRTLSHIHNCVNNVLTYFKALNHQPSICLQLVPTSKLDTQVGWAPSSLGFPKDICPQLSATNGFHIPENF